MNTSDKNIMVYLGIGLIALMIIWYDFVSSADLGIKALIVIITLLIAGCAAFLYYKRSSRDKIEETEEYQEILKRITEKDYLKQIADDIHLIKIIILVFAVLSILSLFGILIYIVNFFSQFPIK